MFSIPPLYAMCTPLLSDQSIRTMDYITHHMLYKMPTA